MHYISTGHVWSRINLSWRALVPDGRVGGNINAGRMEEEASPPSALGCSLHSCWAPGLQGENPELKMQELWVSGCVWFQSVEAEVLPPPLHQMAACWGLQWGHDCDSLGLVLGLWAVTSNLWLVTTFSLSVDFKTLEEVLCFTTFLFHARLTQSVWGIKCLPDSSAASDWNYFLVQNFSMGSLFLISSFTTTLLQDNKQAGPFLSVTSTCQRHRIPLQYTVLWYF